MLLEEGASGRQLFYTAIGDAGANRLNSEGYVGNTAFDATLRFAVPEQVADLGQLSSALLDVELLVTDTRQGDPEAFYDFTNGFESVGVLNCADAAALDDLAPGGPAPGMIDLRPDPATVVSWRYFPAAEAHYLVAYEDLYPNTGDYDFNDMIVSYQVSVGTTEALNVKVIRVEGYMVARGSTFSHDWSLAIDLPAATTGAGTLSLFAPGSAAPMTGYPAQVSLAGDLDIQPFSDSRALLANPLGSAVEQVNTYLNHPPLQQGQRFYVELEIDNNDVDLNTLAAGAPFDPYLFVRDTSQEVHLPNRSIRRWDAINQKETAFVDSNGYPFALLLPSDWAWPIEYVDIGTAYPRLLSFINSSTTQDTDWYLFPVEGLVQPVTTAFWQWAH